MKILIVRTFPDILNIRSYNVQEIGLAKALIEKGHICDIVLYHGNKPDCCETLTFQAGEKEYKLKIFWLKGYNFVKNGYMPSLKRFLSNYDVVQVDEYDLIYSWQLYTKQIRPTVIYHGLYHSDYTKGYNLKCRVFDRIFLPLRRHDQVIALTKSKMAGEFLKNKGFTKIYPVGVGLDAESFDQYVAMDVNAGQKFGLLPVKKKTRLLYVGKLESRRNSLWLLDVWEKLNTRNSQLELVIIGQGSQKYQQLFDRKAKRYIEEESLIYIPRASQAQLKEIYTSCDLFLFPSNYEIFGMVLLEAMYFGMAVISSVNGGSSVLIEDGVDGYLLEDFDKERWVKKILELAKDENKRCMSGVKAAQKIRKRFLWTELSNYFLKAYEQAIEEFPKR